MIADLPVGKNLKDHVFVDLPYTIDKPIALTPREFNSWSTALQYQLFGTGKCAGLEIIIF